MNEKKVLLSKYLMVEIAGIGQAVLVGVCQVYYIRFVTPYLERWFDFPILHCFWFLGWLQQQVLHAPTLRWLLSQVKMVGIFQT
jgi:hypothetical protein